MGTAYLWVKAFHIVFVASWFAGLFYLPRIFVNLAGVAAASHAERERLLLMATRLYRFANLLMLIALGLGLWLWWGFETWRGFSHGWLDLKLVLDGSPTPRLQLPDALRGRVFLKSVQPAKFIPLK